MCPPQISAISSSTKRKQSKKYKLELFVLQDLFHIYIFPLENNIDDNKFWSGVVLRRYEHNSCKCYLNRFVQSETIYITFIIQIIRKKYIQSELPN